MPACTDLSSAADLMRCTSKDLNSRFCSAPRFPAPATIRSARSPPQQITRFPFFAMLTHDVAIEFAVAARERAMRGDFAMRILKQWLVDDDGRHRRAYFQRRRDDARPRGRRRFIPSPSSCRFARPSSPLGGITALITRFRAPPR